jgi:site-specific DNA-methyltransferase (adenine-specific)
MDNLDLLKRLPNNYIDLIYCDILFNTGKKFKDYNDNLGTPKEAIAWYEPRIKEMYRVLKTTGSIYLQMDDHLIHYFKVMMDDIFGHKNFRNEIIWCFNVPSNKANRWSKQHEYILFYSKTDCYYFKSKGIVKSWWDDIETLKSNDKEKVYNGQKPLTLIERIIITSSKPKDIVADFFCGSGTTLVKAQQLKRRFIGCDINPKAVEIASNRLNKVTAIRLPEDYQYQKSVLR